MSSISGTQDKVYLEHIEYVRYPGPRVVGRVRQEADDLKVPDKAHAQEQSEYRQKKILQTQQHGWGSTFFLADPNPAIFLYADPDPDKAAF